MTKEKTSQKKKKGLKNYIPLIIILLVIVGIPLLFLNYQAKRNGMSMGGVVKRIMTKTGSTEVGTENSSKNGSVMSIF
jgi:hypothetical protein